jgi:hypothetical protein
MGKFSKLVNWVVFSFKLGRGIEGKLVLIYMFWRWKLIAYLGASLR